MEKILRILIITDAWTPQVNGVVSTMVSMVDILRERGHVVEVIHPGTFFTICCPGYKELKISIPYPGQVARMIKKFNPDVIHIVTEGPLGLAGRNFCVRKRLRFTTAHHTRFAEYMHEMFGLPVKYGFALMRWFHKHSSAVMVPSLSMCRVLNMNGFKNVKYRSHGVDLSKFSPGDRSFLDDLPRPIYLYAGRVAVEKTLDEFLKLKLNGTKLVYGEGPARAELEKKYPDVVWRNFVPREDLPKIYRSADVFVMPSVSETFGLVTLEAMACGTPAAARPATGNSDIIGDNQGGCLDENLEVAVHKALLVSREAARDRALEFDWQVVCDKFVSFLTNI